MTNAFASVIKTQLDSVLSRHCTQHDAELPGLRHNFAQVFIKGLGDYMACFSTGCGDMQGDVLAPVKFMQAFAPSVERAIKASQSWADQLMLYAWDPLTGAVSDLYYVLYADDLGR
eukprot:227489-Heterocapsa_arctica.AAC.1